MSDDTTPQPAHQPTPDTAPEPRPSRLTRWRTAARDRAGRIRKGIALAVAAALLVGGAGGFALGALVAGDRGGPGDWRDGHGRVEHGGTDDGRQGPPPGVPGQLPPATRDDDSGMQG